MPGTLIMCAQGQNTLAGASFKSFIKQMCWCVMALNLTDDKGSSDVAQIISILCPGVCLTSR